MSAARRPRRRSPYAPPTDPPPTRLAGAILTGGEGSRMGGVAKGTLAGLDGRPLASRLGDLFVSLDIPYTLVGRPDDHASLERPAIADRWPGRGPLGGVATACAWAAAQGAEAVIVLACDLPHLTRPLVERLAAATSGVRAVVFDRGDARITPLPARFAVSVGPLAEARLASDDPSADLSLRGLLRSLGWLSIGLPLSEVHQLDDWDTPEDIGHPPLPPSPSSSEGEEEKGTLVPRVHSTA